MHSLETRENARQKGTTDLTPFLKWAGGKRWLSIFYPQIFPTRFNSYVEPFLGSGAVFFNLRPKSAVLSDVNSELILTFQAIRDNWRAVRIALERHHKKHSTKYYYEERDCIRRVDHEKAARFLYLNRTCWNGLYRVNLQGRFNVPKGTKTNVLLPTDNFESISVALTHATLKSSDFELIIEDAKRGDFIFVDPPYTVKHNVNGFVKYNERIFTWEDQNRLASAVIRAAKRGVKILVTNADHVAIRELYRDVGRFKQLSRFSGLAGDKLSRGETTELAILINYAPKEESDARLS